MDTNRKVKIKLVSAWIDPFVVADLFTDPFQCTFMPQKCKQPSLDSTLLYYSSQPTDKVSSSKIAELVCHTRYTIQIIVRLYRPTLCIQENISGATICMLHRTSAESGKPSPIAYWQVHFANGHSVMLSD